MNKNLEMRLAEVTQPLLTIFGKKEDYPHDRIDYIYERLISNHPHDSICGCSIDSVHDGNRRRFKDAAEALDYLDQKQGEFIAKNTYNDSDYVSFCLINTLPYERMRSVSIDQKMSSASHIFQGKLMPNLWQSLSHMKRKYLDW